MNRIALLALPFTFVLLLQPCAVLAQTREPLAQKLFEAAYDEGGGERVAVFSDVLLRDGVPLHTVTLAGLDRSPACESIDFELVSQLLSAGGSPPDASDCRLHWLSMIGSTQKPRVRSDVVLDNAVVITDTTLGLFFIDPNRSDVSPSFLIDERRKPVPAAEILEASSVGAGRDFSDATVQQLTYAHHRRTWVPGEGPSISNLPVLSRTSFEALFGTSAEAPSPAGAGQPSAAEPN